MIMSGTRPATLLELRLIDIHGTRFYDLVYAHVDAPNLRRSARIGVEDAYPNPQAGDQIAVAYVMNVVIGVKRQDGA